VSASLLMIVAVIAVIVRKGDRHPPACVEV
jgi:hypothetical protein